MAIWFVADWHFNHNREFIYKPRGFSSIEEMNEAIIERHNSVVAPDDDVYVLGDLMLGDNEKGIECLRRLHGRLHITVGNHDTDRRIALYQTLPNVIEIDDAIRFKCVGYHFFLTHYPCMTGNLERESLKQVTCNLYGHTHQRTNFYEDRPYMYHVGVDSHNCYPVEINQIIGEMNSKVKECISFL